MLDTIFQNRNKILSTFIKLGSALGRSLRENVTLFSLDDIYSDSNISYLTESNKLIFGKFSQEDGVPTLYDIVVEDSSILEDTEKFNEFVNSKIHSFLGSLNEDKDEDAETSFNEILTLWEGRLKLKSLQEKFAHKSYSLQDSTDILVSEEIKNLTEIKENLITFLSENKEKITKIPEIRNGIKLSNILTRTFNIPRKTYDDLVKEGSFSYREVTTGSVFDMICRQELIKQELIESKQNFKTIWATNKKIQKLAGLMFEDEDKINKALAEAIVEVPYLAFISKAQLKETLKNCFALNEAVGISDKDFQEYTKLLFEMKKPVKEALLETLNTKYGINVQTLKDPPSFKSLINTQVVIFEALSKISPKGSLLKETLKKASKLLKEKSGVEGLDINDYLNSIFEGAELTEMVSEGALESYLDFDKIAQDLMGVSHILQLIKAKQGGMGQPGQVPGQVPGQMPGQDPGLAPGQPNPALAPDPQADGDFVPAQDALGQEDDAIGQPAMGAEQTPVDSEQDMAALGTQPDAGAGLDPTMQQPGEEQGPEVGTNDIQMYMDQLQALLSDLSANLGVDGGQEEEMPGEEFGGEEFGGEEEMPEEGGEEFDAEGGEEEESEFGAEETEESPEEEETPPKKKKDKKSGSKKFKLDGPDKNIPTEKA